MNREKIEGKMGLKEDIQTGDTIKNQLENLEY
jgi:hypothetical protein